MDLGFGNWPTLQALRNGSRTAFIDAETGAALTHRDLDLRTNALADALRQRGVRRGDRVATLTLNSPQMMEILFATAKIGAIGVPINFRLSAPEVHYVLQDSGASILFESSSLSGTASEAIEGTFVRERVTVPTAAERAEGGDSAYEQLLASGDTHRHEFDISPDDICLIMYTSGTTGRPKGAMLTHRNIQWNVFNSLGFGAGIGREDITLSAARHRRRGRLLPPGRPTEGHDHHRRRERLSDRGRAGHLRAPVGERGRRGRRARRALG